MQIHLLQRRVSAAEIERGAQAGSLAKALRPDVKEIESLGREVPGETCPGPGQELFSRKVSSRDQICGFQKKHLQVTC